MGNDSKMDGWGNQSVERLSPIYVTKRIPRHTQSHRQCQRDTEQTLAAAASGSGVRSSGSAWGQLRSLSDSGKWERQVLRAHPVSNADSEPLLRAVLPSAP